MIIYVRHDNFLIQSDLTLQEVKCLSSTKYCLGIEENKLHNCIIDDTQINISSGT